MRRCVFVVVLPTRQAQDNAMKLGVAKAVIGEQERVVKIIGS
jgi:hypothetical protein